MKIRTRVWYKCADVKPEAWTKVLGFGSDFWTPVWWTGSTWDSGLNYTWQPTHWMMPKLPNKPIDTSDAT